MPYIKIKDRAEIDYGNVHQRNAGEYNYVLTRKVLQFIQNHGISYSTFVLADMYLQDLVQEGQYSPCYFSPKQVETIVSHIRSEIYRRLIKPYEDLKIEENGDVPEYKMLEDQLALMRERRHIK